MFYRIILVLLLSVTLISCSKKEPNNKILNVCDLDNILMAPIYIANKLGYYKEEGLDIKLHKYQSGLESIVGMLDGEIDLAISIDYPVTKLILEGNNLYILSSIAKTNQSKAIISNRSIKTPYDLKNKKIGLIKGASVEYVLNQYLKSLGMNPLDVDLVDIKGMNMSELFDNLTVDALITWHPNTKKLLKERTNLIQYNILSTADILITSTKPEVLNGKKNELEMFFKATNIGLDYLKKYPLKSIDLLKSTPGVEDIDMYNYELALDNMMLESMNNQKEWVSIDSEIKISDYFYKQFIFNISPDKVTYHE